MLDRNEKRDILLNKHEFYRKKRKDRGINSFRHFSKMKFAEITAEDMLSLSIIDHIFKTGDSLSKIAHKYYGESKYWWMIAVFNKKPIDNLIKTGDIIHIPFPVEEVYYLLSRDD